MPRRSMGEAWGEHRQLNPLVTALESASQLKCLGNQTTHWRPRPRKINTITVLWHKKHCYTAAIQLLLCTGFTACQLEKSSKILSLINSRSLKVLEKSLNYTLQSLKTCANNSSSQQALNVYVLCVKGCGPWIQNKLMMSVYQLFVMPAIHLFVVLKMRIILIVWKHN